MNLSLENTLTFKIILSQIIKINYLFNFFGKNKDIFNP